MNTAPNNGGFARRRLAPAVPILAVAAALLSPCGCGPASEGRETSFRFVEVTDRTGIDFRHTNGKSGRKFMVETFAGGVCLLDADGDGRLDIYFVNGADLPGYHSEVPPSNRLFRNEGEWRFRDITAAAGVGDLGYGMGCTAGDYDNDGDADLYVTNFGPNVLYRNNGDGTFTDVTAAAGVGDPNWGSSTAFADYDGDGHIDLFAANYLDYTIAGHRFCGNYRQGYQSYCPDAYDPAGDVLYRNRGDGTFEDVSEAAGVANDNGKGLGVVWGDFDGDGDDDLYVANDITPNFLYRNDGGRFTDIALEAGVAYSENGDVQAGMGTDFGDYDNDGDLDLFVTNFDSETNNLYRNNGDGTFSDLSFFSGLGEISLRFLGFGTDFADYDNDGDLDVFVNNGHILDDIEEHHDIITYAEPNLLFENRGDGTFREIGRTAGDVFLQRKIGRGAASGDLDNDGDLDLVLVNLEDRSQVWENRGGGGNHWITLRLVGVSGNRDGLGARVEITAGGRRQVQEVRSASSYCSQNDMRIHFGLGRSRTVDRLQVRWPGGQVDRFQDIPTDSFLTVEEGGGISETTSRVRTARAEGP